MSPYINYLIAGVALFIVIMAILFYISHDRLRRIAFLRKERLVRYSVIAYKIILDKLKLVEKASNEISAIEVKLKEDEDKKSIIRKFLTYLAFFVSSVLIFVTVIFFSVLSNLLSIIFKALIVWRGYSFINVLRLPSFIHIVERFVSNLYFAVPIPYLNKILEPLVVAISFIANIDLNFLSNVRVSCLGAQAPVRLLFDIIVASVVVIVIESDMAVFWLTALTTATNKFFSMLLDKNFVTHNIYKVMGYTVGVVFFVAILPNPIKVIQYLLGMEQHPVHSV